MATLGCRTARSGPPAHKSEKEWRMSRFLLLGATSLLIGACDPAPTVPPVEAGIQVAAAAEITSRGCPTSASSLRPWSRGSASPSTAGLPATTRA